MSLFEKFKDKMSIGGISIDLDVPNHVKKEDQFIAGSFTLSTQKKQEVKNMVVQLIEKRSVGHGKERRTKKRVRGECSISAGFAINSGDKRQFSFNLPFKGGHSWSDLKGGKINIGGSKTDILETVGSIAAVLSNESVEYFVKVVVYVKDVWRSPSKSQRIILMNKQDNQPDAQKPAQRDPQKPAQCAYHKKQPAKPFKNHYLLKFKKNEPGIKGKTKFGGQPDWQQKPEWPLSKEYGKPMQFLCQIELEAVGFNNYNAKLKIEQLK